MRGHQIIALESPSPSVIAWPLLPRSAFSPRA